MTEGAKNKMSNANSETAITPVARPQRRGDPDIAALKGCVRWLDRSSSRTMLAANLAFINDRYLWHPSRELPEHLRPSD